MKRTRRDFLSSTIALGVGGILGNISLQNLFANNASLLTSASARRKNILFIGVDDLRPELGCYGHPMVKSPNIDALAKNGVLFERTYCQQAVCGPTRASLLTGRRPDTTKVYDLKTHIRATMPDVVTLPQLFKNNGYHSEGMGKIFHSGLEDEDSYSVPHRYPKGGNYVLEENINLQKEGGKTTTSGDTDETRMRANATECADVPDNSYQDGRLTEMAVEALNRLAPSAQETDQVKRKPFFLAVGFRKPHLPFCAPKKYWDIYDRTKIVLPYPDKPKNAPEIAFTNWNELRSYSDIPDVGTCDEAKTRELIHGYYACVSFVDAQVGKIVGELNRLDLLKDTIIILWGDHGWKLGEYSTWSKHTNFELDTHAPMILTDPDSPKDIRVKALTEFVDIYPTLADLCGLPLPEGLEGTSVVPLLGNPDLPWKQAAFSQYPRGKKIMGYSIRTEKYRYTEWQNRKTGEVQDRELYDLKNDPLCKESIVFKSENKELVDKLQVMLKAGWQKAKPE
jgi:iduronate 2-sulfatase